MGRVVLACYRPKGSQHVDALLDLVREHVPLLRREGLATEFEPLVLRSVDGSFVEVFEWVDDAAVEAAHTNPAVAALWERFGVVCEYGTLAALPEGGVPFGTFDPVSL